LIGRMLAKEWDGRTDSMRQVAAELEAIAAGKRRRGGEEPAGNDHSPASAGSQVQALAPEPRSRKLPGHSTPFVGREQELSDVAALLAQAETRLLTILGPGGIGKTRLALATIAGVDGFADGACFVPLTPLKSAEHIPYALAENLNLHFSGHETPWQQLLNYLRRKQMLLVMDNFEHLLSATPLLVEIMETAPHVKVVVTSRERLNLSGEAVYPLAGMTYPDKLSVTEAEVESYGALQLLWQRARRVRPDFAPDQKDLVHAVRICQLVDGMPLALVLAAGWLELLSFAEIAGEIAQSLDFLEGEMHDLPARQRSMRVVFDSSWQRLPAEGQEVFARLSVFRDGFTREAALAVGGASLRTLRLLVSKSLITVRQNGRFDLHELLRQYAEEKLPRYAGEEEVYAAHSTYYLDRLHLLEEDVKGRRQPEALREIDADFENMRAAWEWAVQHKDVAAMDRALESLHLFSDMRQRYQDGATLFLQARDQLAPAPGEPGSLTWARILTRGAFLRLILSAAHWPDVEADLEQALDITRRHENRAEIGLACMALGAYSVLAQANWVRAIALLEQSQACYQAIDDWFYLNRTLGWLAHVHFDVSGTEAYYGLLSQQLALARQAGSQVDMAFTLMTLAEAAIGLGDYAAAERYIHEATMRAGEAGTHGVTAFGKLLQAFLLFLVWGDVDRARAMLQEGRQTADSLNYEVAIAYALAISSLLTAIEPGLCEAARHQAEESLAMPVNNGLGVILAHWGLCLAHSGLGNDLEARHALQTTLRHARDVKSEAVMSWLLPVAALLLAWAQQKQEAVELIALAAAHPLSPTGWQGRWPLLQEMRVGLEAELGPERFQASWERGASLAVAQALGWITNEDT
jgi:predicted ATPase